MKHYLIHVWGCVEPSVVFKGANAEHRDRYAKAFHASKDFNKDRDVLFWLDIDSKGKPKVGAFTAGFMEE
jgi:hypothetical protein